MGKWVVFVFAVASAGCPRERNLFDELRREAQSLRYELRTEVVQSASRIYNELSAVRSALQGQLKAGHDDLVRSLGSALQEIRAFAARASEQRVAPPIGGPAAASAVWPRATAVEALGGHRYAVSRAELLLRASELLGSFASLTIRETPQHGRALSVVKDHPWLERLGLRAGDLLLRLGDVRLDSVETLLSALRATRTGEVALDIERGGRSVRLRYQIRL